MRSLKPLTIISVNLLLLIFYSCSTNSKQEIRKVTDSFYKNYKGDFRTSEKALLSIDLIGKIDTAILKEKKEVQKMAASAYPTDKPDMIEGDVFTSLYDGYTSYKIGDIKLEQNKAIVLVGFIYKEKNPKYKDIQWMDEVVLVKEHGWKIDNVLFKGHSSSISNLKEVLSNFINSNPAK
jgi:hypothetical protein